MKFRKFCSEDLGDKPVSEIPGVGPIAARKLRSMDYSKVLYLPIFSNTLESLIFPKKNETKRGVIITRLIYLLFIYLLLY